MTNPPRRRLLPPPPEDTHLQTLDYTSDSFSQSNDDKLFIQLLDDLDNISGGSQSINRRRRAREIFSEWLFSQDVRNPQVMHLKMEQNEGGGRCHSSDLIDLDRRKHIRLQRSCEAEPFSREMSSRRSCGGMNERFQRLGHFRRARPGSFHYPSEDEDDSGYYTGNSTMLGISIKKRPPSARTEKEQTWFYSDLKQRIELFNRNEQGLFMKLSDDGHSFQGSIRIHMNLTSPVSISARPPTFFDYQSRDVEKMSPEDDVTTSFCLPKNITKVIHISNVDTTQEVIRALLAKFNIADNPRKFILFEKIEVPGKKSAIRQMKDDDFPLSICLNWTDIKGIKCLETNKFILQESSFGENEILWKSFNLVELESFLSVLDREEAEHIDQVKMKYRRLKAEIQKHLQQSISPNEKQVPVFV